MPYYVTKKIKGRPYLYLQWSWREGGKVKTGNTYVAPIDPATGEVQIPERKTPKEVFAEVREAFLNGPNTTPAHSGDFPLSRQFSDDGSVDELPPDIIDPTTKDQKPTKPTSPETRVSARHDTNAGRQDALTADIPPIPDKVELAKRSSKGRWNPDQQPANGHSKRDDVSLTLHAQIYFDELGVSVDTIERKHIRHEQILEDAGLDPTTAPAITMRHGIRHRVRFFRRRNIIAITAPRRGKGAANGLRESFSRALALSKLRALEVQNIAAYQALTLHAKEAQRDTRLNLRKYLMNTNGRGRLNKALGVKLAGKIDPVRQGKSKKFPPSFLGLSAYGDRSDWFEDTTLLLMDIDKHRIGYSGVLNDARAELAKAKGTLTRATKQGFSLKKLVMGERMSWGFRRRREIRRAEARAALQQIRIERLNSLREAFRL